MRLTSEVKNLIVKELDYRIEHHSAIKSVEESPDYLVNIYTWMPREERYRIYPQFDQYLESGRAGNIIHTIAPHIAENMHLELIVIPLHEQEIMRRFFVSELRKIKHTQRHIRNNNDMESLFGALENLTNYLKHSILCTLGEAEVETVETVLLREGWITELHAIMEIEARITSTSLSYSAEHNVGQGASANNSLACPVCCETYDNNNRPQVILACAGTRTNNSHHLCVNCFDEIQSRGKNQCPMCRHIPITARPFGD